MVTRDANKNLGVGGETQFDKRSVNCGVGNIVGIGFVQKVIGVDGILVEVGAGPVAKMVV
jgi:hypothetical protein